MKYIKVIKSIAFLMIFFLIINFAGNIFIDRTRKSDLDLEKDNSIDYFIIGDSEAYTGISPMEIWRKYGFTGYNLGVSAQRLQDTYYLFRKSLKKQSPKVVMFETNTIYSILGFNSETDKVFKSFFNEYFEIYKYHNDWKKFKFFNKKSDDTNSEDVKGTKFKGFKFNNNVKPYTEEICLDETDEVQEISGLQKYYLNEIIKLCNKNNIQLIFYSNPTPVNWKYAKHNAVKNFAEENNLQFIDLNLKNDELKIDWTNETYDGGDHVNFSGAKKITEYIGKYLSQNTSLVDHRQDEEYKEAWNYNLNEYLKDTYQVEN
ncbi:MAG: hypothetical protein E7214_06085 [Clostridium sp.]|nr:hypothetical protein [Clostridium sp.]